MNSKKNRFLWLIFFLVIIASMLFANKSWNNYKIWQTHQAYFEQPEENRKIETWMTPRFIKHYYDLDEIKALSKKVKFLERGLPLKVLCEKRDLDCDAVVEKINKQISE